METTTDNFEANIVYANAALLASRAAVAAFERELHATAVPIHHWHPKLLRSYLLLKRLLAADTRLLTASLQALASAPKSVKAKPPKSAVPISKGPFYQNIEVTVVDGKVISEFDIGPRHWLKTRPVHLCDSWVRHYYFPNAEIPKEYEFVLEHKGLLYGPTRSVYISYPPEEFLRLCQLEVDSPGGHALDGTRLAYKRLSEEEPIGQKEKGPDPL